MDASIFEGFQRQCRERLPGVIDGILKTAPDKKPCAIGFITTDDFYGFYLTWGPADRLREYFSWEQALYPDFLYQTLVEVVDGYKEIDLCSPSEEKWEFARALLAVLAEEIQQLPDEVFQENGVQRADILFFATMSDGDYVQEMMDTSVRMFNSPETAAEYIK